MSLSTKEKLLETGVQLLLRQGYHDTGIQQILAETGVPKGSFYHHFESKEAFGLAVIDYYADRAMDRLNGYLQNSDRPPIENLHQFFMDVLDDYDKTCQGGCLFGNLGQELGGANEQFRTRIEQRFSQITGLIAGALQAALDRGELSPWLDPEEMANLLFSCWQGTLISMKLQQSREPVDAFCRFYFDAMRAA